MKRSIMLVSRDRLMLSIALVIFLGIVTVVGNWLIIDTREESLQSGEEEDALPVMSEQEEMQIDTDLPPEDFEATLSELRFDRDQERSLSIDVLQQIVNNPKSSETMRDEAQERLLDISEKLNMESEAEQLIRTSELDDAVVYILQDSVLVLVKDETLDEEAVSEIASIISRVTGFSWEDIRVRDIS